MRRIYGIDGRRRRVIKRKRGKMTEEGQRWEEKGRGEKEKGERWEEKEIN